MIVIRLLLLAKMIKGETVETPEKTLICELFIDTEYFEPSDSHWERLWCLIDSKSAMLGPWNAEEAPARQEKWEDVVRVAVRDLQQKKMHKSLVYVIRQEKSNPEDLCGFGAVCTIQEPLNYSGSTSVDYIKDVTNKVYLQLCNTTSEKLENECCCFVCFKKTDKENPYHGVEQMFLDGMFATKNDPKGARVSIALPICSDKCLKSSVTAFKEITKTAILMMYDSPKSNRRHRRQQQQSCPDKEEGEEEDKKKTGKAREERKNSL